jgi:hypothetical protein
MARIYETVTLTNQGNLGTIGEKRANRNLKGSLDFERDRRATARKWLEMAVKEQRAIWCTVMRHRKYDQNYGVSELYPEMGGARIGDGRESFGG